MLHFGSANESAQKVSLFTSSEFLEMSLQLEGNARVSEGRLAVQGWVMTWLG